MKAINIKKRIMTLTQQLIETGLCDDQNFPVIKNVGKFTEVTIPIEGNSASLKNISYQEVYRLLRSGRCYNYKLIDGGLLILQYRFCGDNLEKHRLGYFPSPDLQAFQNEPEIYMEDDIYADIIDKRIVAFPLRFDYDSSDKTAQEVEHPISHLTLGDYKNCRIPVSAAVTPEQFLQFIIRNFYHTAYCRYCDRLTWDGENFVETIFPSEKQLVHIQLPVSAI